MLKVLTPFLNSLPHWAIKSEFMPNSEKTQDMTDITCKAGNPTQEVCYAMLFSISGFYLSKFIKMYFTRNYPLLLQAW